MAFDDRAGADRQERDDRAPPRAERPQQQQEDAAHRREGRVEEAALQHGLAVWDVYAQCRREGSLDSAIRDAVPNDLPSLVRGLPRLQAIAHNGAESARAMKATAALGLPVYRLPSTSPANASWSFERKLAAWREVFVRHQLA